MAQQFSFFFHFNEPSIQMNQSTQSTQSTQTPREWCTCHPSEPTTKSSEPSSKSLSSKSEPSSKPSSKSSSKPSSKPKIESVEQRRVRLFLDQTLVPTSDPMEEPLVSEVFDLYKAKTRSLQEINDFGKFLNKSNVKEQEKVFYKSVAASRRRNHGQLKVVSGYKISY